MNRSNCHFRAWSKFTRGEAEWLAIRHSEYSKLRRVAEHWLWRWTLRPIGIALQWTGMVVVFPGWFLRDGGWPHFAWVLPGGEWREFVPISEKEERLAPPIIFVGKDLNKIILK